MRSFAVLATFASLATSTLALPSPPPASSDSAVASTSAQPITVPLTRRGNAKRGGSEGFLRRVNHLKSKYGKPTTNKRSRRRDGTVAMTSYTDSEFYGTVSIGTPAVDYNVILDTGSSDLIIAASGCSGCSTQTTGYSADSSSTAGTSTTAFSITYGSGSASGTLAQDTVSIGGYTMEKQTFAACDVLDSIIDADISGLLGLGWGTIASSGATPLVEGLASNGTLPSQVFGFEFATYAYDEFTSDEMPGGTLTIGSTDTSAYSGDINWVDIVQPAGYWSIPLDAVSVSGNDVGITADAVIIDSGTTLIGAPSSAVAAIYAQIDGSAETDLDGSSGYYSIPCDTSMNVTFTFGGIAYSIPSESFNAGATDSKGTSCLGAIFVLENSSSASWIVGDAFLTGVYSAFRFSDPPAVGFATLGSGGTSVSDSSSSSYTTSSSNNTSAASPTKGKALSVVTALALVAACFW